jgi:hypothetical protein
MTPPTRQRHDAIDGSQEVGIDAGTVEAKVGQVLSVL